jgi:hypothetical protein
MPEGAIMKLMLTYDGPLLSSGNKSHAGAKNSLRRHFHHQLVAMCRDNFRFRYLLEPGGRTLVGMQFEAVARSGFAVELEIEMLRRDSPGEIFNGGDIDGRLKTLLDGLRMPNDAGEVVGFEPTGDACQDRCICLLEDDRQVRRVSIRTDRLLRPLRTDEKSTDVELRIRAVIEPVQEV